MEIYGLIGKTLKHSFSKEYFTNKFVAGGINAEYHNFEFDSVEKIRPTIDKVEHLVGLNVTIPYKEKIIPYLDDIEESAKQIGAVNTILIKNNKWIGFNTDQFGFINSLKPFLSNKHERALILGTGGASLAIRFALEQRSIKCFTVSREKGKADLCYNEINEHVIKACNLIVNTTPVGMYPNVDSCINLPDEYLGSDHLLYDLIYNPEKTSFLKKGEKRGASIMNGIDMLKHQAEKSWEIWESKK
jgi:shikimate dehydrogenase